LFFLEAYFNNLKIRPALNKLMGGTQAVQAPVSAGSSVLGCGTMEESKTQTPNHKFIDVLHNGRG
jgi:hypothetical protein